MKWLLFIIFICLSSTVCKAQIDTNTVTGKKVIAKMQQLRYVKIDTMVCYYLKCSGRIPQLMIPDSCTTYDVVYLLWCNKKNSFIQKFDECDNYNAVTMNPAFLRLIKAKYVTILKEKIYPPEYTVIVKGRSVTYDMIRDHTCHTVFEMHFGDSTHVAGLNNFETETKYIDGKHLNKNYYRNQNTTLNKLKIIVEKEIAILNK